MIGKGGDAMTEPNDPAAARSANFAADGNEKDRRANAGLSRMRMRGRQSR
jgi:hypothetical protein